LLKVFGSDRKGKVIKVKARRTFGIVALALAASFLAGCGRPYTSPDPYSGSNGSSGLPQTPQLPSGTVVGRIVDARTGLGVADVEISVLGVMPARSTRSNGSGEFTLNQVPANKVKLSLYKQGYTYLASYGDVVVDVLAGNTVTAPEIKIAAHTDAVTNSFVMSFGNLDRPRGLTIDDTNGFMHVVSYQPYLFDLNPLKVWGIRKFNLSGGLKDEFGANLFINDLDDPQGIAVDKGGNLFVTDPGKTFGSPIRQYDLNGKYRAPASNSNEFADVSKPQDLVVMRTGVFGVSSAGNNQVKFFAQNRSTPAVNPNQAPLKLNTTFTSGLRGLTVDANDNIYVIDVNAKGGELIQKFDAYGNRVMYFGYIRPGRELGSFSNPTDLAVDNRNGEIYVVDSGNNRIQRFNHDGTFLSEFGGMGSGNGKFNNPHSIAVDKEGYVYVSDTGNNRVQKFAPSRLQQVGQSAY
jgi:uncharacterized protein YjiK